MQTTASETKIVSDTAVGGDNHDHHKPSIAGALQLLKNIKLPNLPGHDKVKEVEGECCGFFSSSGSPTHCKQAQHRCQRPALLQIWSLPSILVHRAIATACSWLLGHGLAGDRDRTAVCTTHSVCARIHHTQYEH